MGYRFLFGATVLSEQTTSHAEKPVINPMPHLLPLTNYSLSSVCPACEAETVRRACKVRCDRCGFMWDCSEL
jgi:hypothetical protein